MKIKDMSLPSCMMPDGAPPCDSYQELYYRANRLEHAISKIAPWLSASLSDGVTKTCKEYREACNAILEADQL